MNLCRYLLSRSCVVRSLDIAPFGYPKWVAVDENRLAGSPWATVFFALEDPVSRLIVALTVIVTPLAK
jgi:hypothetical protein